MNQEIPNTQHNPPIPPDPPPVTIFPMFHSIVDDERDRFEAAVKDLMGGEVAGQCIEHTKTKLKTLKLSKGFVIVRDGEFVDHAFMFLKGSGLSKGNRWDELRRLMGEEAETLKMISGPYVLKQRNPEIIEYVEFFKEPQFIFPSGFIEGEASQVEIILTEDIILLCVERKDYIDLKNLYTDIGKVSDEVIRRRNLALIENERVLEGFTPKQAMLWLGRKWKGALRFLSKMRIGKFLGFSREAVNINLHEVNRILRDEGL